MSKHAELIERLRKQCANTNGRSIEQVLDDFIGNMDEAADALEAQAREIEGLRNEVDALSQDAACFRFWVREAAQSPCDMAKLIMRCVTEQDYRDVIMPIALAADKAIDAAKGASHG